MPSTPISPNQSEVRVGARRVAVYQRRSWWGGSYWEGGGVKARNERELTKALEAKAKPVKSWWAW
jgi:hypothetical protein